MSNVTDRKPPRRRAAARRTAPGRAARERAEATRRRTLSTLADLDFWLGQALGAPRDAEA